MKIHDLDEGKRADDEFVEDKELAWDGVYLLGWYDHEGKGYLTTWKGTMPYVHVVVTGCNGLNMPLWDAHVPPNARLHPVPGDKDPEDYAKEMGGYHAFGWKIPVVRRTPGVPQSATMGKPVTSR
jgi:hypothetical protein